MVFQLKENFLLLQRIKVKMHKRHLALSINTDDKTLSKQGGGKLIFFLYIFWCVFL